MKYLIDTDGGVDDALALILAFLLPLDITGITTVVGNTTTTQAYNNVHRILSLGAQQQIPVLQGEATPMKGTFTVSPDIHGADGLGNLNKYTHPDGTPRYPQYTPPPTPHNAVSFIIEQAKHHKENLTIITLGPLTNIAQAIQTDPNAMEGIKQLLIMGGAARVPGNMGQGHGEFNFYVDPYAASKTLEANIPKTLVGLDVTEKSSLSYQSITQKLQPRTDPISQFIIDITSHYISYHEQQYNFSGLFYHDAMAVLAAVYPQHFRLEHLHVSVDPHSTHPRGVLSTSQPQNNSQRSHAQVCLDLNSLALKEILWKLILTQ